MRAARTISFLDFLKKHPFVVEIFSPCAEVAGARFFSNPALANEAMKEFRAWKHAASAQEAQASSASCKTFSAADADGKVLWVSLSDIELENQARLFKERKKTTIAREDNHAEEIIL